MTSWRACTCETWTKKCIDGWILAKFRRLNGTRVTKFPLKSDEEWRESICFRVSTKMQRCYLWNHNGLGKLGLDTAQINQLSSPRYHSLFAYFWFKSGYVVEKLEEFWNPVDFFFKAFSKTLCEISGCQNVAVIRCSWCKSSWCFKHFFEEHHYCTTYNE